MCPAFFPVPVVRKEGLQLLALQDSEFPPGFPRSFHPPSTPLYPLPSLYHANLPQWYEIITDARHKKPRLNLYQFDGAPANPLYLEYRPPQMLPTTAFHSTRPTDNENKKGRRKRDIGYEAIRNIKGVEKMGSVKEEWLVVLGIGMTALGSVGFFWF